MGMGERAGIGWAYTTSGSNRNWKGLILTQISPEKSRNADPVFHDNCNYSLIPETFEKNPGHKQLPIS